MKKSILKKKKRKRGNGYSAQNRKQNHINSKKKNFSFFLPVAIRDCTWIENEESNFSLLIEKGKMYQIEKEKKK